MKGDADATHCFRSIAEGVPFQTHGAMAEAGQVLNQSNILEAFEAMKKLDFFVDSNLWEDPISSLADILLPEQHWMEIPFATRCTQGSNGFYGAHINCIKPLGETRFGNDWICELYKVHGTPFWDRSADGGDPWEWEDYLMNRAVQSTGMTWQEYVQEFLENGWIDARKANPNGWGCYRRFITGWNKLGHAGYNTNTSRHEVWVTNFEAKMRNNTEQCTGEKYGTKYALPYYTEPKSSPNGWAVVTSRFRATTLITPTTRKSRATRLTSIPTSCLPDAVSRSISTPNTASFPGVARFGRFRGWRSTRRTLRTLVLNRAIGRGLKPRSGKIRQCVDISPNVAEGRMNAEHSWWFPRA